MNRKRGENGEEGRERAGEEAWERERELHMEMENMRESMSLSSHSLTFGSKC